jgi:hypothetical protein
LLAQLAAGLPSDDDLDSSAPAATTSQASLRLKNKADKAHQANERVPRRPGATQRPANAVRQQIRVVKPSANSLTAFSTSSERKNTTQLAQEGYRERFSGLRIMNPLLGSQDIDRAMSGERFMRLDEMCNTNVDRLQEIDVRPLYRYNHAYWA